MHNPLVLDIHKGFHYGMHALGEAQGVIFANCREGLQKWYEKGIRFFEVDVSPTDDEQYVACHSFDVDGFHEQGITDVPEVCTAEWYLEQKIYTNKSTGLSTVSLEELLDFISDRGDVILMIDFKRCDYESTSAIWLYLNTMIKKKDLKGEQILFEVYDQNMLDATKTVESKIQLVFNVEDDIEVGNSQAIRSLPLTEIVNWMKSNNINIVSYPWKRAVENLPKLKRLKDEGFAVISRTRNDIFSELLERSGVNVNLVSCLCTEDNKKLLADYKNEYFLRHEDNVIHVFGSL